MARAFTIEPLDASFGARVTGLRLAALEPSAWDELYEAWLQYALLIFPGQRLGRAD